MSNLWLTIGHLVRAGLTPEPKIVAPEGERLHVKLRTPEDVDAWRLHIGLPPAHRYSGEYGSTDFLAAPGWCGFTVVSVYCDLPMPASGDGFRVLAADRGDATIGAYKLIAVLVVLALLCFGVIEL